MPDLRDETTEDGFHEIQLSGKQLVFLFMVTTVLSILIFLVGVLVGRDMATKGIGETADSEMASTSVPSGEPVSGQPAAEPPQAVDDELTYHSRLQSNAAPTEPPPQVQEAPPADTQPPAETPAPPAAAAADVPTAGQPGTWVLQIIALKNQAAAAELVQRLVKGGYPAYLQNPGRNEPEIYRVRVGKFKDRAEAQQMSRRLEKEEQLTSVITR